jgi:putative N-acetylmannosamine-6-phosphate epimerase
MPGDRRAWDAVLLIGTAQIAVEAETRPRDVQALQRRIALKRRDHGEALMADLPMGSAAILTALTEGRRPEGSGVVLV